METRIQIDQAEPEAYKAVLALEKYLAKSQLTNTHKELIKIRASQLNRCAFCLDMHTKDALNYGETQQRIFLLEAWHETDLFTEEEQVILKMTEEITLIHQQGLTAATYQKATSLFDEHYFSQIIMAISVINVWNRMSVSTHKPIGN